MSTITEGKDTMTTIPVHPGAILREDVLAELNMTVTDAASRLGIDRTTLSRVLHEHAGISPDLALRLEAAGVSTARAWLALQSAYDLARLAGSHRDVRPLTSAA